MDAVAAGGQSWTNTVLDLVSLALGFPKLQVKYDQSCLFES